MKHISLIFFLFLCINHTIYAMEIIHEKQTGPYPQAIQLCVHAMATDNIEMLQQGLSLEENFNYDLLNKISLLHIACSANKNKNFALEILKKKNIDLTIQTDESGYSALHAACKNNFPEAAAIMLEQNPQTAHLVTKKGSLPLHIAAEQGNEDCVTLLLNHDKTSLYKQDYNGNTPLHTACAAMQFDTIEQLIKNGACPTIKNYRQETPFYTLFFSLHGDLEDFLNERNSFIYNALVHSSDAHKNTQLHLCAQIYMNQSRELNLYQDYISFLCDNINKDAKNNRQLTALNIASKLHRKIHKQYIAEKLPYIAQALNNQLTITQNLLALIDPDQTDLEANDEENINSEKLSKTISFCKTGTFHKNKHLCNTDMVTFSLATTSCLKGIESNSMYLLNIGKKMGADMNPNGFSLLCRACETSNDKIVKKVLKYTSIEDVIAIDFPTGDTPLHAAFKRNRPIIGQWILDKNPEAAFVFNKDKISPLDIVMSNKDTACLECILQKHPTIAETINAKKQSLLQKTILDMRSNHTQVLLTTTQKNINYQNYQGNTALHLACNLNITHRDQRCNLIQLLIINGADTTIKNYFHATPLIMLFSTTNSSFHDYLFTQYPEIAKALIHAKDTHNNNQFHLCTKLQSFSNILRGYLPFLASHGVDIQLRNNYSKRPIDCVIKEYNTLHKEYIKTRSPYIKSALYNQEYVMHEFLRFTSPYTQCVLFKAMLNLKGRKRSKLLPELITKIMRTYYALNIETIVAKKNTKDAYYYINEYIENKNNMKRQLCIYPEPQLLWSAYAL